MAKFAGLHAQVLGISVDSVDCLKAWAKSLGGISYPLLSDFWPHGEVAKRFGVLREDGRGERAIFALDREGVVRYIDIHEIGQQPSNDVLLAELRRIDPQSASAEPREAAAAPLPKGGIVMYCTKWCHDCRHAREWLQARGLDYVEVDVYGVPGAGTQVREWCEGKLITPTFDIDGVIVKDFNEKRLAEVLGHRAAR
jgi:glutaredoxin